MSELTECLEEMIEYAEEHYQRLQAEYAGYEELGGVAECREAIDKAKRLLTAMADEPGAMSDRRKTLRKLADRFAPMASEDTVFLQVSEWNVVRAELTAQARLIDVLRRDRTQYRAAAVQWIDRAHKAEDALVETMQNIPLSRAAEQKIAFLQLRGFTFDHVQYRHPDSGETCTVTPLGRVDFDEPVNDREQPEDQKREDF